MESEKLGGGGLPQRRLRAAASIRAAAEVTAESISRLIEVFLYVCSVLTSDYDNPFQIGQWQAECEQDVEQICHLFHLVWPSLANTQEQTASNVMWSDLVHTG